MKVLSEVYIDTNFYLRLVLNDVPKQNEKCRQIIELARDGKCNLHVTDEVICEIVFVLLKVYKLDRIHIKEGLSFFLSHKFVKSENKESVFLALEIFLKTNLSIVDSVLVSKANFNEYAIATFDEDIIKTAKVNNLSVV